MMYSHPAYPPDDWSAQYTFIVILQVFRSDFTISAPWRVWRCGVQKLALSVKIWNRSLLSAFVQLGHR